jgi:hypothetical protein
LAAAISSWLSKSVCPFRNEQLLKELWRGGGRYNLTMLMDPDNVSVRQRRQMKGGKARAQPPPASLPLSALRRRIHTSQGRRPEHGAEAALPRQVRLRYPFHADAVRCPHCNTSVARAAWALDAGRHEALLEPTFEWALRRQLFAAADQGNAEALTDLLKAGLGVLPCAAPAAPRPPRRA